MLDLQVLDDPATAAVALEPLRSRILGCLHEPGSASTVAQQLGLPRQQVNYHLRALEKHGLVTLVEHRQRRGLRERVVQASAASYALAASTLGLAPDPQRIDQLSARYLVALASRLIEEVGRMSRRAEQSGRTLSTLGIDTEIRFASAQDRAAFTAELAEAVTRLAARYHDETARAGRWHRLIVAAHPRPTAKEQP